MCAHTGVDSVSGMADRVSFVSEWTSADNVATVTTAINEVLVTMGGKVDTDDPTAASFGSAIGYRILGAYLPGAEDRMPMQIVVDIRPGDTAADTHLRAEARREDDGYLVRADFLEDKAAGLYAKRFAEIISALRAATSATS